MSAEQLRAAIELGEKIGTGEADLVALDRRSLQIRGKMGNDKERLRGVEEVEFEQADFVSGTADRKRKYAEEEDDATTISAMPKQQKSQKRQSTLPFAPLSQPSHIPSPPATTLSTDLEPILHKISTHPTLTPYRKRLYSTLCSVPRGRYTTYATLSSFLDSSARAVGNGMRNNPFAPEVPCHRVLAADGSIGGFCGSWGKDGEHASKKVKLLRDEGVRFDGKGKVIGEPFRRFVDLSKATPH